MVRKTALVTAMLGAFASQAFAMGLGDLRLHRVRQPLVPGVAAVCHRLQLRRLFLRDVQPRAEEVSSAGCRVQQRAAAQLLVRVQQGSAGEAGADDEPARHRARRSATQL